MAQTVAVATIAATEAAVKAATEAASKAVAVDSGLTVKLTAAGIAGLARS